MPYRQVFSFRSSGISTDFYFLSLIEIPTILHFGPCVADKGNTSQMFIARILTQDTNLCPCSPFSPFIHTTISAFLPQLFLQWIWVRLSASSEEAVFQLKVPLEKQAASYVHFSLGSLISFWYFLERHSQALFGSFVVNSTHRGHTGLNAPAQTTCVVCTQYV